MIHQQYSFEKFKTEQAVSKYLTRRRSRSAEVIQHSTPSTPQAGSPCQHVAYPDNMLFVGIYVFTAPVVVAVTLQLGSLGALWESGVPRLHLRRRGHCASQPEHGHRLWAACWPAPHTLTLSCASTGAHVRAPHAECSNRRYAVSVLQATNYGKRQMAPRLMAFAGGLQRTLSCRSKSPKVQWQTETLEAVESMVGCCASCVVHYNVLLDQSCATALSSRCKRA